MHEALGIALLFVQTALLLPLLLHAFKTRSTQGMSLTGEVLWTIAGLGWMVYAILSDSYTVIASGFIAMIGSGILSILIWRNTTSKEHRIALLVAAPSFIIGFLLTFINGQNGLSLALAIFGAVQFIPQIVTTVRTFKTRSPPLGVSIVGASLRAFYTAGWSLYAAGFAVWGLTSPDIQWPLFVWGLAGLIAFGFQASVAYLSKQRNWSAKL